MRANNEFNAEPRRPASAADRAESGMRRMDVGKGESADA